MNPYISSEEATQPTQALHPLPADIGAALRQHHLADACRSRSAYYNDDCVEWITRARRETTGQRRPAQTIEEL